MWRVWIEILHVTDNVLTLLKSPSVWRVWIEITGRPERKVEERSPSVWRVWIEINTPFSLSIHALVTLRVEGVD